MNSNNNNNYDNNNNNKSTAPAAAVTTTTTTITKTSTTAVIRVALYGARAVRDHTLTPRQSQTISHLQLVPTRPRHPSATPTLLSVFVGNRFPRTLETRQFKYSQYSQKCSGK